MQKQFDDDGDNDDLDVKQFKVIFLGDGAVGKTSIIMRFTKDHFDPEQRYKQTIGLDFFLKQLQITEKLQVSLQCWDIGGQTIGQKMIKNYLRGSNAILFVYDITNQSSFQNLENWMTFVKEVFPESEKQPYMALIGNKTDLGYQRKVSVEEHSAFADKYGIRFFYMSARTGDNVLPAMIKVASDLADVKKPYVEIEREAMAASVATIQRDHETTIDGKTSDDIIASSSQPSKGNKESKSKDKKSGKEKCIIL
ncbi:Rab28a [Monocercomonoides exilis]|uniref:Rab28a n=1 Tax=Monocercomonoides exilis TaxID=2049356 RepID=UPI00355980D8|nr:Rab28a [Monocercomonoides exilis]|eukprot:MONOS_1978.1-p1 / transcript=MONOS_1978.1 / gene=MONOS_1978 / organism=Monocercomonoides_exilis_PA203 / gene_product=Rab28a / transcript_product=Rab28a / location=Mono_scaffold00038:46456-47484(-) / protein_length=253 / sequence_SO=supercontig / SO=protein_coding / is_pseudo=false